jgi:hypothetical protein
MAVRAQLLALVLTDPQRTQVDRFASDSGSVSQSKDPTHVHGCVRKRQRAPPGRLRTGLLLGMQLLFSPSPVFHRRCAEFLVPFNRMAPGATQLEAGCDGALLRVQNWYRTRAELLTSTGMELGVRTPSTGMELGVRTTSTCRTALVMSSINSYLHSAQLPIPCAASCTSLQSTYSISLAPRALVPYYYVVPHTTYQGRRTHGTPCDSSSLLLCSTTYHIPGKTYSWHPM